MIKCTEYSSCPCIACPATPIDFIQSYVPPIIPTSLSTNSDSCDLPLEFTCTNKQTFNLNQQPPIKYSKSTFPKSSKVCCLNPNFGLDFATDFTPVVNTKKECPNVVYKSLDSRLISPPHEIGLRVPLNLDKPVYTGETQLKNIYNKDLAGYGQSSKWKSYKDIHSGQIRYYFAKDLTPVLYDPLFVIQSNVTSQLFEDPMSSHKFQTIRNPIFVNNRNISEYQFDRDQMAFRENLIHSQMAVMNQQDFNHVWGQENLS